MHTSDPCGDTNVPPRALLTDTNPPPPSPSLAGPPPAPPSRPKAALPAKLSIATLEIRTPEEDVMFQECETIIGQGWGTFAAVGTALATIKGKRLYKNEFTSFETYAWERWGFGNSHLWRYLAAADVHKVLKAVPGIPMPECEAQTRPLTSLSPELALQAWLQTLEWSKGGPITALLVRRAVRKVVNTEQPANPEKVNVDRQKRYRVRQSIQTGFKELLTMIMGSADRDALLTKVGEIQRLLEPLLGGKKETP